MIDIRPFTSLGHADHGWLDARHHFSFADYHDPARMGWGRLRVWNDDRIAAKSGFPPHPHRNMEIITYVRAGAITHQDSLGNLGRTEAGDVQVMSAGAGIVHAEYNLEDVETTLFQLWIQTDERGAPPSWGSRPFPKADRAGRFVPLASGLGEAGDALPIRATARVSGAMLKSGDRLRVDLRPLPFAYLVAATGALVLDGQPVSARDGVAIRDLADVDIRAVSDSEVVLVQTT